jgi:hypothetical protein
MIRDIPILRVGQFCQLLGKDFGKPPSGLSSKRTSEEEAVCSLPIWHGFLNVYLALRQRFCVKVRCEWVNFRYRYQSITSLRVSNLDSHPTCNSLYNYHQLSILYNIIYNYIYTLYNIIYTRILYTYIQPFIHPDGVYRRPGGPSALNAAILAATILASRLQTAQEARSIKLGVKRFSE